MGKTKPIVLTNSMASCFQSCRKKYQFRYVDEIVRTDESVVALSFGSAVHAALERWFKYGVKDDAVLVARSFPGLELENQIKAAVLVERYIQHWCEDEKLFEIVGIEAEFKTPLRNPDTNAKSRTFTICGKADGIVRMNGELFILEHKTTSCLDDVYIQRIQIDKQIAIYADSISREMREPVAGAIYDIIQKPGIRMKKGETDEEFAARRAALIAKSKTGTTRAVKQEPETEDEFEARMRGVVDDSYFRREIIRFERAKIDEHIKELWSIAKDIRSGNYYRNTGECNAIGRKCPYLDLCVCGGDMSLCEGLYEHKRAHVELSEELVDD